MIVYAGEFHAEVKVSAFRASRFTPRQEREFQTIPASVDTLSRNGSARLLDARLPRAQTSGNISLIPPHVKSAIPVDEDEAFPGNRERWPVEVETPAQALERSCRNFLPAIYRTVRAGGLSHEDAEDIAQEFVVGFVQSSSLFHPGPRNTRLRPWLYQRLQDFLHRRHCEENCLRKGGHQTFLALDDTPPDEQPVTEAPADQVYDREWAAMLLQHAVDALKHEYEARGEGVLFDLIRPALTGADSSLPCTAIARNAGLPPAQVTTELQHARRRLGEALRHEVSATVHSVPEIDEELRYVLTALAYQG